VAYFEQFNPFVDYVPTWPFRRLNVIAHRAARLLGAHEIEELRRIASMIDETIAERKERYVESQTDAYVQRLASQGGWELKYFSGEAEEISEASIRKMLSDWPADADESPELPDADDLADADALQEALDYDLLEDPCRGWNENLPDYNSTPELWAVFALMKVEDALGWLGWVKSPSGITPGGLSIASQFAMEAAEGLLEMERLRAIEIERFATAHRAAGALIPSMAERKKERAKERSKKALDTRNARRYEARDWAWSEWLRVGIKEYDSKREFARDYVMVKVPVLFQSARGKPITVTENQVCDVWLMGPRVRG
jgi:hypothetical protein